MMVTSYKVEVPDLWNLWTKKNILMETWNQNRIVRVVAFPPTGLSKSKKEKENRMRRKREGYSTIPVILRTQWAV